MRASLRGGKLDLDLEMEIFLHLNVHADIWS